MSGVAVPRGGIREKINTIGRGPRERCRSVPRGAPFLLFYLRHFFARCLTLVPRSLLLTVQRRLLHRLWRTERAVPLCVTGWRQEVICSWWR